MAVEQKQLSRQMTIAMGKFLASMAVICATVSYSIHKKPPCIIVPSTNLLVQQNLPAWVCFFCFVEKGAKQHPE